MPRIEAIGLAAALCASLSACAPADRETQPAASHAPALAGAATPPTATAADAPSREPAAHTAQTGDDQVTPAAARQVVIDYYAAIDARDYPKAYSSWSDDGAASGQTFELFSGGYANTRSVKANVGEPVGEEGAAGSRYIQVPVELTALQQDGSERRYRGRFTLRAVLADGASEAQRRWHLASAEMQRVSN